MLERLRERLTAVRPPALATPALSPERLLAWEVLAGKTMNPAELMALGRKLKSEQAFTLARRVLGRALADPRLGVRPPILVHPTSEF